MKLKKLIRITMSSFKCVLTMEDHTVNYIEDKHELPVLHQLGVLYQDIIDNVLMLTFLQKGLNFITIISLHMLTNWRDFLFCLMEINLHVASYFIKLSFHVDVFSMN